MASEVRNRKWVTFRLWGEDHTLLRTLASRRADTSDRYSALLALIPIVKELNLPDIRNNKRQPLRVGIPDELHTELERMKEKTGQSNTDILLEAARIYAEINPISEDE